ncbi:MAG: DNA repair protein RecN [Prevotella sp.]|nr:DNA repair protein RecN [Prevotella sp.]
MLKRLYIKHFTLIDELDITFDAGFSVITGETGAGKSIILGAIGLLLGQRADAKSVKNGHERCVIEAHFDLSRYGLEPFFESNDLDYDATDTILRRELNISGKSRAFINDCPVGIAVLRELGDQLMDIHSQHQNLLLKKEDFQLGVVDILTPDKNTLTEYRSLYHEYQSVQRQLDELRQNIDQQRDNEDFLRYQLQELQQAGLSDGEQQELEQKSETMAHAEDIKGGLYQAFQLLDGDDGVVQRLRSIAHELHAIEQVFPAAAELAERIDSTHIELKDIAAEVERHTDDVEFDPQELERINERLDTIYHLEKKHHVEDIGALLVLQTQLEEQLSRIDHGDELLHEMEEKTSALKAQCERVAWRLTTLRMESARQVEHEMCERLVPLGMPHVRFKVSMEEKALSADGKDKVSFLFSANTNTPMQPISQVASGGEISRVMLSLKAMISGAVKLPTIIFDEIDTGVSGKTAEQMARIMHEMGEQERQVISITHLPQIAAMGTHHYKVYKEEGSEGTTSHMVRLTDAERVEEIAQMLSGNNVSAAALENARELMKIKRLEN